MVRVPGMLRFTVEWHVLWAALLLPYALVVTIVFAGQDAAANLVDGLAGSFVMVPVLVIAALPLNLATAGAIWYALGGSSLVTRMVLCGAVFGGVWFFAIQPILGLLGLNIELSTEAESLWAAVAGAAYGCVWAIGTAEPLGSPTT
jgi:hypothetical protein